MATPAAALQQGVKLWNEWRKNKDKDGRSLDLTGADLAGRDLTGIDLRGVNLSNANLRKATLAKGSLLWNANLSGADLYGANLRGADLQDVNFSGADLFQADLRETNLQGADLSTAKGGLLSKQLAGSDLTGAKLPEPLAKLYDGLSQVKEISDSAQKLFLALLVGCLYSWLTIAQTTDVELITNRATTPLPIIQAAIPIVGFYVVAPLILLCLYFYFHFYLQKLWEELGSLPAVFTDGRPLHNRTDPWLLNDIVRSHCAKLKIGRPFLSYFQAWVSVVLAWWLVPVTLLLFWGRFLRRHDLFWTLFHALLLAISIIAAVWLYHLANKTLRGDERRPFLLKVILKKQNTYLRTAMAVVLAAFLGAISVGAIYGDPTIEPDDLSTGAHGPRTWVPVVMSRLGYSPFANLANADVSIKPANWTGKKDEELDLVKGANLLGTNLRNADAKGTFFVNANLSEALMEGVDLENADLRHAILEDANLQNAHMRYIHLEGAHLIIAHLDHAVIHFSHLKDAQLYYAELSGADLTAADLRHANLSHANLNSAELALSNLEAASLKFANLQNASLRGANFTQAQFEGARIRYADFRTKNAILLPDDRPRGGLTQKMIVAAKDWQLAFYDPDVLKQLGLPPDHNEQLQKQMEAEQRAQPAAVTPDEER